MMQKFYESAPLVSGSHPDCVSTDVVVEAGVRGGIVGHSE